MSCDKSSCLCWRLWPCLRAWSAGTLAQEVSKPLWVGFPLPLPRPLGLWLRGPVGRAGAGKVVLSRIKSGRPLPDSTIAPRRHLGLGAGCGDEDQQGPCATGVWGPKCGLPYFGLGRGGHGAS